MEILDLPFSSDQIRLWETHTDRWGKILKYFQFPLYQAMSYFCHVCSRFQGTENEYIYSFLGRNTALYDSMID